MNEIKKQYLDGVSSLSIAKNLNIPYRQVRSFLSKEGILKSKKRIKNSEFNFDFFYNIDAPEKAYFLGLFHGDACVHTTPDNKLRFVINLKEEDGYLLQKLMVLLGLPLSKVKIRPQRIGGPQYVFQSGNSDFIKPLLDIKNLNIVDKIPKEFINHFLRGVFDADGTIYTKYSKKTYRYYYMGYIGNEALVQFVNEYSPVRFKFRSTNSKGIYRAEIYSKEDVLTFGEFLYKDSTVHMHRKYNKFLDAKFHYRTSTTTRKTPDSLLKGDDIV